MKKIILLLLAFGAQGCAVMDWSNAYGTDFCAYPSGIIVGVPTAAAASMVAGPAAAIGLGLAAGGTMILNGYNNYGGLDIKDCKRSFDKIVLKKEQDNISN